MPPPRGSKEVSIDFPLKGLNRTGPDGSQPRGTTREAVNVLPFVNDGRGRGGSRPGHVAVTGELAGPVTLIMSPVATKDPVASYRVGYAEIEDRFFGPDSPGGPLNVNTAAGIADRWTARKATSSNVSITNEFTDVWGATPYAGADLNLAVGVWNGLAANNVGSGEFADGSGYVGNFRSFGVGTFRDRFMCLWDSPTAPPAGAYAIRGRVQILSNDYNDRGSAHVFCRASGTTLNTSVTLPGNGPIILKVNGSGAMFLYSGECLLASFYGQGDEFLTGPAGFGWLELIVDGNLITGAWNGKPYLQVTSAAGAGNNGWGFGGSVKHFSGGDYEFTNWFRTVGRYTAVQVPATEGFRRPYVCVVAGGVIYQGDNLQTLAPLAAGAPALLPGRKPQGTWTGMRAFYVDGTNSVVQDLANGNLFPWVATGGKGTVPAGCRLVCLWRGRLVLANQADFPMNVYLSRSGDPHDWLYGGTDALAPVALNASSAAGRIGQPVYALIPFRDDNLVIGCDHSLYVLAGDPQSSSGQIITLSESIGILGPDAWTQDPEGTVYFLGSGGFYRMSGTTSEPVNVGRDRLNEYFRGVDRSKVWAELEWDRDRHGCWIWLATSADAPGKGLWWDARLDAFFELAVPERFGPVCAFVYDGDAATDRYVWLGGRDGVIRQMDPAAATDDGDPIDSNVLIGPVQPFGDFDDASLTRFETVWGTGTTGATLELLAGGDAAAALAATPQTLGTFAAGGRAAPILTRNRANSFFFRVRSAAGGGWSMERIRAVASFGGQNRG